MNKETADIPTILVIDDTLLNLKLMVDVLENQNYRVFVARDGAEGLQRAAFVKPDLILLDVMMPEMDGFEVCRRLKSQADTRDIPVIFMTSLIDTENKVKAFKIGGVDYITKPIQIDELIARVGTHLSLQAMRKQLAAQNEQLQSHQVELEHKLCACEREFRSLAENSPDVIVRYDRECRRIYFNQAYLNTIPADHAEAFGKTPLEFWYLTSPSAEEYTERLQHVMNTGESDELLVEMSDREGLPAHRIMFLVPEFNDDSQVVSVLSISHDITGIKRMETMLRKSELEFRTLAENSPGIIVRYDLECRRIYINPAYEKETGIPLETVWNKPPTENWKPLMPCEEYLSKLKHVMETGKADSILLEWYRPDGKLISHDMRAVAEYDEEGQVIGALIMGHNITELKNTERHLEESRAQLRALTTKREEAREEERKRIAREIHDELGQLLNVLRLNVTTLDFRFGDANADLRGKAHKMVEIVDRAIMMVRNLATRLRPAVLNSGIVSALDWLAKEYMESTGITCKLHLPTEDIPLDEDRAMVVFRIVQESLTNVLRHSGARRVDITLLYESDYCEVEVRDNGKGFNPVNVGRLNSYGIIGMQERALILKGTLDIANSETGGTVLKLRIPIECKNEKPNQSVTHKKRQAT